MASTCAFSARCAELPARRNEAGVPKPEHRAAEGRTDFGSVLPLRLAGVLAFRDGTPQLRRVAVESRLRQAVAQPRRSRFTAVALQPREEELRSKARRIPAGRPRRGRARCALTSSS
jgi:hypothetical protein